VLYFRDRGLAFLAVPKAASTSVERHLARFAAPRLPADAFPKHMTARQFQLRWATFRPKTPRPETFAILRDPIDRIGSWYRYRQRPEIVGQPQSTSGLDFDAFVRACLAENPPPYARIGNQHAFCTGPAGEILVTHLFDYAAPAALAAFLADRFGADGPLPHRNRSPARRLSLSPETEAAFRAARAAECTLYAQVAAAGHLVTPPGN